MEWEDNIKMTILARAYLALAFNSGKNRGDATTLKNLGDKLEEKILSCIHSTLTAKMEEVEGRIRETQSKC